jgi:hypothetical protein
MGSGIAEVRVRTGLDVLVVESNDAAAEAGHQRLEKSLQRPEAGASSIAPPRCWTGSWYSPGSSSWPTGSW